jgi:hypothetical protein
MKVLLITKADAAYETETDPVEAVGGAESMQAMGKVIDEMVAAGILLSADGIKPSRFGKRVEIAGTGVVASTEPV